MAEPGVTQWRPGLRERSSPIVIVVLAGSNAVARLLLSERGRLQLIDLASVTLLAVTAGVALVEALRTRVRILPDGLEVRQLRLRRYPWSEITDVQVDPWSGNRRVRITLADGTSPLLPTPRAPRRRSSGGVSDAALLEVVSAVEARLPPGRQREPAAVPTALDDLLHD